MNLSGGESSSSMITEGIARWIPEGYEERIIKYGNNSCDCDITAFIGVYIHPIIINYVTFSFFKTILFSSLFT